MQIKETLGSRMDQYVTILAHGTAGGFIMAWNNEVFTKIDQKVGRFCLTVDLVANWNSTVMRFTTVYGPTVYRDREEFFQEIKENKPHIDMP